MLTENVNLRFVETYNAKSKGKTARTDARRRHNFRIEILAGYYVFSFVTFLWTSKEK